ncbi:hypothetical protein [uncultured Sneathiella sp.]|uniref:hypothetical protein n=1 Tax=uncultured Sneathiella sp. TaxID=879315 RepID=UPI0030EB5D58|tara:strand:- start:3189 stop:3875 length:687 start_codon:yes stop_codon:yes gene_type:complete
MSLDENEYEIEGDLDVDIDLFEDILSISYLPLDVLCDGSYARRVWKKEGFIHRDGDLPAVEYYHIETNKVVAREWVQYGLRHRENDRPAFTWEEGWFNEEKGEYVSGDIIQVYYQRGHIHRDGDFPAITQDTGQFLICEVWLQWGKQHRLNNPAKIGRHYETGIIDSEDWRFAGLPHRETGKAAWILRNGETGQVQSEQYFEHGREVDRNGTPLEYLKTQTDHLDFSP